MKTGPTETAPRPDPPSGLALVLQQERGSLLRFVAVRCGSAEQAEDLLQDLWIKVAEPGAARSPGPIGNPRAYLFRMANNLVLDAARGRQRAMRREAVWLDTESEAPAVRPEERVDPAEPADRAIERRQEADILAAAIGSLPPGAARALRLYRFEGQGQGDIARIMGISRSGVEKHLALAMKHLRAALADCGFFDPATSLQKGHEGGANPRREQGR